MNNRLIEIVVALDEISEQDIEQLDFENFLNLLKNDIDPRDLNFSAHTFNENNLNILDDGMPGDDDTIRWLIKDKLLDVLDALGEYQKTEAFMNLDADKKNAIEGAEKQLSNIISYKRHIIVDTVPLVQAVKEGDYDKVLTVDFSAMEISIAIEVLSFLLAAEEFMYADVFLKGYIEFADSHTDNYIESENLRRIVLGEFFNVLYSQEKEFENKQNNIDSSLKCGAIREILSTLELRESIDAKPLDEAMIKEKKLKFDNVVKAKAIPIDTEKKPLVARSDDMWKASYEEFKEGTEVKDEIRPDISMMHHSREFQFKPHRSRVDEDDYNTGATNKYKRSDREYWNKKFAQIPPPIPTGAINLSAAAAGPSVVVNTGVNQYV